MHIATQLSLHIKPKYNLHNSQAKKYNLKKLKIFRLHTYCTTYFQQNKNQLQKDFKYILAILSITFYNITNDNFTH